MIFGGPLPDNGSPHHAAGMTKTADIGARRRTPTPFEPLPTFARLVPGSTTPDQRMTSGSHLAGCAATLSTPHGRAPICEEIRQIRSHGLALCAVLHLPGVLEDVPGDPASRISPGPAIGHHR